MKIIFKNFEQFLITWGIIIIINQIFIFSACFKLYCLISAMPHTFIIATLITYFINKDNETKDSE
jgi:hypothetical protein